MCICDVLICWWMYDTLMNVWYFDALINAQNPCYLCEHSITNAQECQPPEYFPPPALQNLTDTLKNTLIPYKYPQGTWQRTAGILYCTHTSMEHYYVGCVFLGTEAKV